MIQQVGLMPTIFFCLLSALLLCSRESNGQLTKNTAPGTCRTDLDCALLGACVAGGCVCDPGFTGPNCQRFDLLPSRVSSIDGFDNPAYPAWGGKTIYADGKWHWVGTYIRGRCDIWEYPTNSAFLRASGDHPLGPFTYQGEVLPPFHHGAQVERALDGSYHIFGDGRDMPEYTVKTNCAVTGGGRRQLSSDSQRQRSLQSGNLYPKGNSPNDVHIVATAPKITGPWTQYTIDELSTDVGSFKKWNCNKTNLAPLLLKNGTVIMGFRSKSCVDMQEQMKTCGMSCQRVGIAVSHHGVKGPYQVRANPIPGLDGNEDPFMWKSNRGYHFVFHGKEICGDAQTAINTCGAYAYSRDTYTWYLSPFAAYDSRVEFDPSTGKSSETLKLRHRPKITFSNEGVPMVLYNSGQRQGQAYVRNFAFGFNVPDITQYRAPPPCPEKPFVNECTHHTRRGIVYDRTEPGCAMMGSSRCTWCASKNQCMPGGDNRVCTATSLETFWAHC